MRKSAARERAKPRLDRRESLAGVPVLNDGVTVDRDDDGNWLLVVRQPRRRGLFSRFLPPVMERRTQLDSLGTSVVRQIDGKRDTGAIIKAFVAEHRLNGREAELSVVAFLKSLVQRNLVSIIVKKPR